MLGGIEFCRCVPVQWPRIDCSWHNEYGSWDIPDFLTHREDHDSRMQQTRL
jgi:hypothetical protein